MAVVKKEFVKDAKGNPIQGLYKLTYAGGSTTYERNFQKNFERKYITSKNRDKQIRDQLAFLKTKPESNLQKIRNYLDNLLKKKGTIWVNQGELATELNVGAPDISKTLSEAKYNRIKTTLTSSPAEFAKARGQDSKAFVKYLKDNNISDDNWYKGQQGGGFRTLTLRNFTSGLKEAERIKSIPKGYISEPDLSAKMFNGNRSELSEKIQSGKKRFSSSLAAGVKKLNPVEGRTAGNFNLVNFYKDPTAIELKNLIDISREYRQIQERTLDHINTILKDKEISKLLKNFSTNDSLPSWDRMKEIYTKQKLIPPSNNTMATAVVHLARVLQDKGKRGTEGLKIPKNKAAGKILLKKMSAGSMFGNPWAAAAQKEIYDLIDEGLGRKVGTFDKFRRDVKTILRKADIPMYSGEGTSGFNLNEVLGTRGQFKNLALPYTQFVDLAEGAFNQKQLNVFQKQLNSRQAAVMSALKNNDITEAKKIIRDVRDIRSDLATKFKKANLGDIYISKEWADLNRQDIGGHYKGRAYVKPLSEIYKQLDVDIWKEQYGLDLEKFGRERGVNVAVGGARPIEQILTPGYQNTLLKNLAGIRKEFKNNTGGVCKIFGTRSLAAGGSAAGCVREFDAALKNDSPGLMKKMASIDEGATGALGKIRNMGRGFLGLMGKVGPTAGKYGAIVAAGALAKPAFDMVRQFVNDDPSTYLTDPEQMERMLLSTIEAQERKKPRSEILDWSLGGAELGATAAAVPGSGALMRARRMKGFGLPRQALGPAMKLVSGMFTPAGLLATEPLRIAQMRREGESWGEVAKSPTLWMGPAFAPGMTKLATAGMKSSPLLAKALRLGMSPGALRMMGRVGMPGLALSLGLTGYDKYKDWKNKRGWFAKD